MENKKLVLASIACLIIASGTLYLFNTKKEAPVQTVENNVQIENKVDEQTVKEEQPDLTTTTTTTKKATPTVIKAVAVKNDVTQKSNLYKDLPAEMIPLSGIAEITGISNDAKKAVNSIVDNSQNIYMIKNMGDKLLLVTENPDNVRHGIDFVEISLKTGHQTRTTLGYSDKMQDSNNDYWEFDSEKANKMPIKHIKYNKDGDMDFVETWNYNNEPVKYEMKNSDGKVISLKKEVLDENQNLRIEHLIYDKDGHTKVNVTTSYEGPDLKRFTYYNADKPAESASIYGEYEDGLKIKETIYTSDLKVKNVYKANYDNGLRNEIVVLDENNNEIRKVLSE